MSTIINTPATTGTEAGSGLAFIVGLTVLAGAVILFILYGVPAIRMAATQPNSEPSTNIEVTVPSPAPAPTPAPSPVPAPAPVK